MKRLFGFVLIVLMLATLSSCAKKQDAEELQPITLETLGTTGGSTQVMPDLKAQEVKILTSQALATTQAKEGLPMLPQGPYKPSNIEIQTALKHAGFYTDKIDGKIGPKSKKAIEDFQGANGLKVDGKVGPKTWEVLGKHLIAASEPVNR